MMRRSWPPDRLAAGRPRGPAAAAWWQGCAAAILAAWTVVVLGCGASREAAPHPLVVIGIDGAEWRVIERLWQEGRLPHLKALAGRGVRTHLGTDYGVSPVIWTTIATGVKPSRHGITDFVVASERGDVPVSSSLRRVPALWNMASAAGRRVGGGGWWASWPAEQVNGVVVSDRALAPVPDRVFPPGLLPAFLELVKQQDAAGRRFPGEELAGRRDTVTAAVAERLAAEAHDLLLVYFRAVDIVSHRSWKYFEPEAFGGFAPGELAAHREDIPGVYEATDAAIGRIVAAAGPGANVVVVSDHGFRAAGRETLQVFFNLDAVLARLGYLSWDATGGVDLGKSRVFTYNSPHHHVIKRLRFSLVGREPGGTVRLEERAALRAGLAADLARVTHESGAPVFSLRDGAPRHRQAGADFVVEVLTEGIGPTLRLGQETIAGAVGQVSRVSGNHGRGTRGIFLAAGPDIDPTVDVAGIGIHDLAPTFLYGLGLPVAEDFAGIAWTELFRPAFRARVPLRTIATWGTLPAGAARTSEVDGEILDELRALGYLD